MILAFPAPPQDVPQFKQRTKLDDQEYLFTFNWNSRSDSWAFDLATNDGTLIMCGVKILLGRDLLQRCLSASKPPGRLVALSSDESKALPSRTQLGDRVKLYYFSEDETTELEPA